MSPRRFMLAVGLFLFPLAPLAVASCESTSDGSSGPLTQCDFSYKVKNAGGKDLGVSCTSDSECEYGVCLKPGATGNLTNSQFGFCTRGCDCDDNTDSRIPEDEKDFYSCLYPPGNQGSQHHVVLKCNGVADCTAVDPAWTSCATPSSGGARPICQAQ